MEVLLYNDNDTQFNDLVVGVCRRVPVKGIISAAVLTTLLVGRAVFAQDIAALQTEAGITPDSRWYALELIGEDIWAALLNDFSEAEYQKVRAAERLAEARVMSQEKGVLSSEVKNALDLMYRHEQKSLDIISRLAGEERAMETLRNLRGVHAQIFRDEFTARQEKDRLMSRRNDLRAQILEALKIKDEIKAAALEKLLDKAREDYEELDLRVTNIISTAEVMTERSEDLLTRKERAESVVKRAEEAQKESAGGRLAKLLEETQVAIADDSQNIDRLTKELQKAVHDARLEAGKRLAAEEAKKDIVAAPKPPEVPKKPVNRPKPPAAKPKLETIPSETVKTEPLAILYYPNLNGEVDVRIDLAYGAQGGLPPYHFQLDSGVGFPPSGVILDVSGRLSGTPKAAGTYRFSACAIDTAGSSSCEVTVLVVAAAAPPPPPPPPAEPEVETTIAITSTSCAGDGLHMEVHGTASGPVRSSISISYGDAVSCGSWTVNQFGGCDRKAGQSDATQWTFSYYKGQVSGDSQQITILSPGDVKRRVTYQKNCP